MAKIEMYVWDDCPYCKRAREILARNGVDMNGPDYEEHDITNNPKARQEMEDRMEAISAAVAPQVFVDDILVGCCADLLDLEIEGRLAARLGLES